jgi:single-strand DNA-binding protein
MNKVFLIGRLGKDAETTSFDNGKKVTKFSLATTEYYGGKEEAVWHYIDFWGDSGAKLSQYLTKGSQVSVEGRISYNAYEKDGEKKVYTVISCDRLEMLDSKKSNEATEDNTKVKPAEASNQHKEAKQEVPAFTPAKDTDDLPF